MTHIPHMPHKHFPVEDLQGGSKIGRGDHLQKGQAQRIDLILTYFVVPHLPLHGQRSKTVPHIRLWPM